MVKKVYSVGDDVFMIIAFISFMVGVVFRLLDISPILWGITPKQLINGAVVCLLFSIAFGLKDITQASK